MIQELLIAVRLASSQQDQAGSMGNDSRSLGCNFKKPGKLEAFPLLRPIWITVVGMTV
jgi:hypothetical protein